MAVHNGAPLVMTSRGPSPVAPILGLVDARRGARVDRVRCAHCRNPIKPQHATAGDSFHEDCWELAQQVTVASALEQQLDYQRQVAAEGLSALLAPYL